MSPVNFTPLFPIAQMMGIAVPSARLASLVEGRAGELGIDANQPGAVERLMEGIERDRLRLVRASVEQHDWLPYRAPLDRLSATERGAVRLFATVVKPLIDGIEANQQDPNFPLLDRFMSEHGDHYSRLLWRRFRRDTLTGPLAADRRGSLFPFFPELPPINGMIDPRITLAQFQAHIGGLSVYDEELRPTTVFERDDGKGIKGTPLPLHPRFKEAHGDLAEALDQIEGLNVDRPLDERLRDQLRKWAQYCRTGTMADEAAAVQATIDAGEGGGLLRVHLGPSESYWPDNLLFPYILHVGIRDPEVEGRFESQKRFFPQLESLLAGIPHYQPRLLAHRGGFANPLYQSVTGGFVETFNQGEPLGINFPNHSYEGVSGSNRFIFIEAVAAAANQIKPLLGRLLDDTDMNEWDARGDSILYNVAHESGHLLGPLRDHILTTGERMGLRFGAHWGDAEEPKADLTIGPLVRLLRENGDVSADQARGLLRAFLGWGLSNRYRGKEAFFQGALSNHRYGHMIKTGFFFKIGALSLRGGRIHVDYDNLLKATEQLWREIIAFQAAGDVEGFLESARRLVEEIPDEADAMILEANKDLRPFFIERYLF